MEAYLCMLGRSAELSIEELVAALKSLGTITDVSRRFVVVKGSLDPRSLLAALGGTIKIARIVKTKERISVFTVDDWLHILRTELSLNGEHRFNFGLSVYSDNADAKKHMWRTGLALKKHIKKLSVPVRFVFNDDGVLPSVAVQKSRLLNRELCVAEGKEIYFGITEAVQDFDAYGFRDVGRPARNMRRGMLPPKLAQIMLNLGAVTRADRLLDPFCGGGTILQEALLRGVSKVTGSDKDGHAIEEARRNTEWLSKHFNTGAPVLKVIDVFDIGSAFPEESFDAVITEGYLGPADVLRKHTLTRETFSVIARETTRLYHFFFKTIHPLLTPRGRAVVILPVFRFMGEEYSTASFETIEAGGWRIQNPAVASLVSAPRLSSRGQLLYERDDQLVAREITVWKKQ